MHVFLGKHAQNDGSRFSLSYLISVVYLSYPISVLYLRYNSTCINLIYPRLFNGSFIA